MEDVPILEPLIVDGKLHISRKQIAAWRDWEKRASQELDHLEEQMDGVAKFLKASMTLGFDTPEVINHAKGE